MGRYLDLARRALESAAGATGGEISEKREQRIGDPYQELARAYLSKICRDDYPAGMIPWLGNSHAALYHELTSALPDEIHKLWAEKAPITEFDRILNIWLEAHRTACDLYRKART